MAVRKAGFVLLYFAIGAVLGTATAHNFGAHGTPSAQDYSSLLFWSNASCLIAIMGIFGIAVSLYKRWSRQRCDDSFTCMSCRDANKHCCEHYAMERRSLVFWTKATLFPSLALVGFAALYFWTATPALV